MNRIASESGKTVFVGPTLRCGGEFDTLALLTLISGRAIFRHLASGGGLAESSQADQFIRTLRGGLAIGGRLAKMVDADLADRTII